MASGLKIYQEARAALQNKRRELLGIMLAGDNLGELATGFINIQTAIEAVDRAIEDERRLADLALGGR